MRRMAVALALVAAVAGMSDAQDKTKKRKIVLPPDSLYNIPAKSLEGQPVDLKDMAGQVALVVNLASR